MKNHSSRRSMLVHGVILLAGLLAVGSGPATADVLENVAKAGVVKIGVFEDFPPFASLGSDMQIQGYDVDMANLIGKALGVKAELVGINGQNRIPFLTEQKVDLLLSIGFSDERAQVVDFTAPYAPYYIVVMGPRDVEVKGPADLKRLRWLCRMSRRIMDRFFSRRGCSNLYHYPTRTKVRGLFAWSRARSRLSRLACRFKSWIWKKIACTCRLTCWSGIHVPESHFSRF